LVFELLPSMSGSAAFYAYPEGLAVAAVVFLPIFIFYFLKILQHASAWRSFLLLMGIFIFSGLLRGKGNRWSWRNSIDLKTSAIVGHQAGLAI
jgi:hypothetical protein